MQLYAFSAHDIPKHAGYLKIGETHGNVEERVKQQGHELNVENEIVWTDAVITDRTNIDKLLHRYLKEQGFHVQQFGTGRDTEWVKCTIGDLEKTFAVIKQRLYDEEKQREEVGKQFYLEIRNWFYWTTQENKNIDGDYALRLVIRLLFCFFLREKDGLVPKELLDANILQHLKSDEYSYFGGILRNLFFHCLNTPGRRKYENEKLLVDKNIKNWFSSIPFLNGGLFDEHDQDDIPIGNDYFFSDKRTRTLTELGEKCEVYGIITILSKYQYKLTLDDLLEQAEYKTVDPEFIGKVFESLLSCIDLDSKESRQRVTGSYYTPREIVDYMVNEALDAYLIHRSRGVSQGSTDSRGVSQEENLAYASGSVNDLLLQCKILDPACDSGAFPCEAMNIIMHRIEEEKKENGQPKLSPQERYYLKLDIIRNVLYGVDIQPMTVQITVLRFFLSLMQDIIPDKKQNREKTNYNIKPLPNLETKFVCADTLIGVKLDYHASLGGKAITQATIDNLRETRRQYFMSSDPREKARLREYDEKLRKSLAKAIEGGIDASASGKERFDWNPYDQSLCASFFDSIWMFGIESFDIVIGNPPYVRQELLGQERKTTLAEQFPEIANGTADLYVYFYGAGLRVLSDNGVLIYISQNKYLKTKYGVGLRNEFTTKYDVKMIIDFFELPVFTASTDCAITQIIKRQQTEETKYFPIKTLQNLDLPKLTKDTFEKVIKDETEWKFVNETAERILKKLYENTLSLEKFTDGKIFRGITTRLNDAFVLDKDDAKRLLNSESKDLVKPYAKSTDIQKYRLKEENSFFLATGFDVDIENKYPSAYEHLRRFEDKLLIRQDRGKNWWNLRACAYYSDFALPKLIYIHTAVDHQFYYDTEGRYINNSCYMIVSDSKFLFAFLNSRLFSWFKKIKFVAYGNASVKGRAKLDYNKMVTVPIKDVTPEQETSFALLVDKILSAKKEDSQADTSVLEREIDALIYVLYGLTDEEIAVLEN